MNWVLTRFLAWMLALLIFPVPAQMLLRSFCVEVLELADALPQERDLDLSERVVLRLVEAEAREPDAWYRDDYRLSRVTVGLAARGNPVPHIEASYALLGVHPDKVWPRIVARRRAAIGAIDYEKLFGANPPRKPVQSERVWPQRKNAA